MFIYYFCFYLVALYGIADSVDEQCIEPCVVYFNKDTIYRQSYNSKTWVLYNSALPSSQLAEKNVGTIRMLYNDKRFVWYDMKSKKLFVSSFDANSEMFMLASLEENDLQDFTVDWNRRLIYWTDVSDRSVKVVSMDGNNKQQSFVQTMDQDPSLIEYSSSETDGIFLFVVTNKNKIYTIKQFQPKENVKTIVSINQKINSLSVDSIGKRVYWSQSDPQMTQYRVYSVPFSGGLQAALHHTNFGKLHGLTMLNNGQDRYLYFISSKSINRVKLTTSSGVWQPNQIGVQADLNDLSSTPSSIQNGLLVINKDSQIEIKDYCEEVACQHFCLYARSIQDFSCTCDLGFDLEGDKKTCRLGNVKVSLYIVSPTNTLLQMDVLSNHIVKAHETVVDNFNLNNIVSVTTMAAGKDSIFFVDDKNKWLGRVELDSGSVTILKTSFEHSDAKILKYDSISDVILVASASRAQVFAVTMEGDVKTLVTLSPYAIKDITLISSKNMFAVLYDYQSTSKIDVYNLGGSRKYSQALPNRATAFVYNEQKGVIFWHNKHTNVIHSWTIGTIYTNVILNDVGQITHMFSGGSSVYYVTKSGKMYSFEAQEQNPKKSRLAKAQMYTGSFVVQHSTAASDHQCTNDNGGCSHFCLRRFGDSTPWCACPNGMTLNGKICEQTTTGCYAPDCLYYTIDDAIYQTSTVSQGDHNNKLFSGMGGNIEVMAVDEAADVIFWVQENNMIFRSTLRGRLIAKLNIKAAIGIVTGLSVDRRTQLIYWSDMLQNNIYVSNYDGSKTSLLTDEFVWSPSAVKVDEINRKIFWTNTMSGQFSMGIFDLTSNKKTIVPLSAQATSLHLDPWLNIVFYARKSGGIFAMKYGDNQERNINSLSNEGLVLQPNASVIYVQQGAMLHGYRYNSSLNLQRIVSDGDIVIPGVATGTSAANLILTAAPSDAITTCSADGVTCESRGICYQPLKCLCEIGTELSVAAEQCIEKHPSESVLMLGGESIYQYDIYNKGGRKRDMGVPTAFLQDLLKNSDITIMIDDLKNPWIVYLYENKHKSIMQFDLNSMDGNVLTRLPDAANVTSLCYDYITRMFFFLSHNTIYHSSLDGERMLTEVNQNTSSKKKLLTIDPRKRLLFYVSDDNNAIIQTKYSGQGEKVVRILDQKNPVLAMKADIYHDRLYWIQNYQLQSCSQDGEHCFILVGQTGIEMTASVKIDTHLNQVSDIAVNHRDVFWFVGELGEIYKMNKLVGGKVRRITSNLKQQKLDWLFAVQIENPNSITIPEDQDTYLQRFVFSYGLSGDQPICSVTKQQCGQNLVPSLNNPTCPTGYRAERTLGPTCVQCNEMVGDEFSCQCNNEISCAHRWNVRNVYCSLQKPWLYMISTECQKTIRSGFCPYHQCTQNEAIIDVCNSDDECANDAHKCCSTFCGRRCLEKTSNDQSECVANNGECSHVCIADQSNAAVCQCPMEMKMNGDGETCFYAQGYCSSVKPCDQNTQVCVDKEGSYECLQLECSDDSCLNGASCAVSNRSIICKCDVDFYGEKCQYRKLCPSSPCLNGGSCTEMYGKITCTCPDGYSGSLCQTKIVTNPCSFIQCQNGGLCTVLDNMGPKCLCSDGYSGSLCQTKIVINPCSSIQCQNGGSCTVLDNTGPKCLCSDGYSGSLCQTKIVTNPCSSIQCQNGGSCTVDNTGPKCLCSDGYSGSLCQTKIVTNPCSSIQCQNGGSCTVDNTGPKCLCSDGYSGSLCQTKIVTNPCSSIQCQNGGSCTVDNTGPKCLCSDGYSGSRCQTKIVTNPCSSIQCQNGGSCTVDNTGPKCLCSDGYSGNLCQTKIVTNPCSSIQCQNGGSCTVDNTGPKCLCSDGYSGSLCQTKIVTNPCSSIQCQNGGSCTVDNTGPKCLCSDGYSGSLCQTKIVTNPCSSIQCQNGGSCTVDNTGPKCLCSDGYSGSRCQTKIVTNPCSSIQCQNGGSCTVLDNTGPKCLCSDGYSGSRCQTKIVTNPCSSIQCQNGGSCTVDNTGPKCLCSDGYSGSRCQTKIVTNPCSSIQCQNGGSCTVDNTGPKCLCSDGYSGNLCQTKIVTNPCSSIQCQNGGSCILSDGDKYRCKCRTQYVGDFCENLHHCYKQPCLNGASCALMNETYKCLCEKFYTGIHCETYFEDHVVSVIFNPTSGQKITKYQFQVTMANIYNEYCSTNECFDASTKQETKRRKRATDAVTFIPEHILVVQGHPKELGTGEVQVLYTVVVPDTKTTTFVTTTTIIDGIETSTVTLKKELGTSVASAQKYSQSPSTKPEKENSQVVLIGAAAGGGAVVLIVLIITLGCCYVKRKGSDKNVQIQMTDQNGRLSIVTAKVNKDQRNSVDLDLDPRYTSTDFRHPFNRATLGLAPPPPDYLQSSASGIYQDVNNYEIGKDNGGHYLESGDINNLDIPRTVSNGGPKYRELEPVDIAKEREKSWNLNNDSLYASLDTTSCDRDDYMTLQQG